jgi:3-hydroxyisobutyrate dehydrogenase
VTTRVGFVGLGRMGLPMCTNLVCAGYPVTAGDVDPGRRAEARAAGAMWQSSTAEVAAGADVLITMLPGPAEVEDAMLSAGGLAALRRGTTWIDMTSNSPRVGGVLSVRAGELGVGVIDAPVGGGPREAAAGSLQLFVGGPADLVAQHRSLLEVLADPSRIVHVGAHGSGYVAKLLANTLWFGQAVAVAEVLLIGRKAGLDLGVLRHAFGIGAAGSRLIDHDLDALFAGDYVRVFGLDRCTDELGAVIDLSHELGVPVEVATLVDAIYRRALARYGPVDGELLAVAMLEEEAGVDLRHG